MNIRFCTLVALAGIAASSNAAIVFSNFVYGPGAVTAGFSVGPVISGNSLTWTPANAQVGDLLPSRLMIIGLTYDAKSTGAAINAVLGTVNSTTQGFVSGLGQIQFQEDVFELDALGNEVGGPIGTATAMANANSPVLPPSTITLSKQVLSVRVKKSFVLAAPDSATAATFDYAGISLVNQSVQTVPEPASMAALGVGAVALLRRRKRA